MKRVANVSSVLDYVVLGAGSQYWENVRNSEDRVAALSTDYGDIETFVAEAHRLARESKHPRKIEALSIVQSFSSDEIDPSVEGNEQYVNDLACSWLVTCCLIPLRSL